ncbi:MAG: hypothetical protein A2381_19410 [Bdellovibrionales bacterium RIFOXYB1_FULL_37_110]|nr:MAG: hypothetical protein A2417_10910 [Bdellovibrionales bacterium RIFOXYC1_FULL_37_79]OFZ60650.1 MAG: hypothetical protein A2381_19410 [Bdellovibrionales bacterium RIFOXYB1_FULL_37_110]OFZ64402.1 MAG: hypothetical protein A2577_10060 [Bdellovibrionales bacterium RIFOXYD1_FULL_36_51]
MKKLIISFKSSSEVMNDFKNSLKRASKGKIKEPHHEISFDSRKSFERFAKNIHILSSILAFKPKSIYELAKLTGTDVSNLNKIVIFFEEIGAIKIKKSILNGREIKMPIVDYDEINIDLKAA